MAIPGPQIYRPFVWLPLQEHCLTNILALDRRVGEHGKLVRAGVILSKTAKTLTIRPGNDRVEGMSCSLYPSRR